MFNERTHACDIFQGRTVTDTADKHGMHSHVNLQKRLTAFRLISPSTGV